MRELTLDEKITILQAVGYRLDIDDYYNPGGETYHDAVFYPDGKTDKYGVFPDIDTSLKAQWQRAWKHYQTNLKPSE